MRIHDLGALLPNLLFNLHAREFEGFDGGAAAQAIFVPVSPDLPILIEREQGALQFDPIFIRPTWCFAKPERLPREFVRLPIYRYAGFEFVGVPRCADPNLKGRVRPSRGRRRRWLQRSRHWIQRWQSHAAAETVPTAAARAQLKAAREQPSPAIVASFFSFASIAVPAPRRACGAISAAAVGHLLAVHPAAMARKTGMTKFSAAVFVPPLCAPSSTMSVGTTRNAARAAITTDHSRGLS